ncbi:hypothetical protein B0H19DRAFT_1058671 [Mycena capillaripes]|nr:hypothetical protein B0H19DRAFT_1058671 [Mycena capillaripes]
MENTTLATPAAIDLSGGIIEIEYSVDSRIPGGMDIILVVFALIFLHRRRPAGAGIFGCLIGMMCILATAEMILQAATIPLAFRPLRSAVEGGLAGFQTQEHVLQRQNTVLSLAENIVVITNNAVADVLLIYRCYVIWRTSHKKVVALPTLFALGATVSGYVQAYQGYAFQSTHEDLRIFFALVLLTNGTLTGLTVGRILYTGRQLRATSQVGFIQRLESGAIYLLGSSAAIVVQSLAGSTKPVASLSLGSIKGSSGWGKRSNGRELFHTDNIFPSKMEAMHSKTVNQACLKSSKVSSFPRLAFPPGRDRLAGNYLRVKSGSQKICEGVKVKAI